MASNPEKLAQEFQQKGYPEMKDYLNTGAKIARKLGAPESFSDEIPTANKEIYRKVLEAVEPTGYNFVANIRPVSIKYLLVEDEQGKRNSRRLGYVNNSKTMQATVPPEMKIAINPNKFRIEGSNSLPTDEQKKKIREEEARWKSQLPEDIRPFVSMRMVDPSTLSQLEDAYMDRNAGKLLLSNYFARTDVQTVPGVVAVVGRVNSTAQRDVDGWARGDGVYGVFAVSVVVLPRKSAI